MVNLSRKKILKEHITFLRSVHRFTAYGEDARTDEVTGI